MSDVSCLQTLLTFGDGHHTTLIVNILFKTSIFPKIGKKYNQSTFSDADRDIPTIWITDNASVNLVSGIVRLPSGWNWRPMIDSIYLPSQTGW